MNGLYVFRLILSLTVIGIGSQNLMAEALVPGRYNTYDANGRLVKVVVSNGNTAVTVTYTYDQAGNLLGISKP
jgi:YD repeat-containing protein